MYVSCYILKIWLVYYIKISEYIYFTDWQYIDNMPRLSVSIITFDVYLKLSINTITKQCVYHTVERRNCQAIYAPRA